jgi:hypothetical protein
MNVIVRMIMKVKVRVKMRIKITMAMTTIREHERKNDNERRREKRDRQSHNEARQSIFRSNTPSNARRIEAKYKARIGEHIAPRSGISRTARCISSCEATYRAPLGAYRASDSEHIEHR